MKVLQLWGVFKVLLFRALSHNPRVKENGSSDRSFCPSDHRKPVLVSLIFRARLGEVVEIDF
jgi:hypothetical protein